MDLYPSPSRSWFCSLNLAFYISFPFPFLLPLPPSSGTVPLLPTLSFHRPVALDFRPLSLFLSRLLVVLVPLAFQRWSVPLSTTAYSFPRAIPCSDCLTPTLRVRTTERPPRSLPPVAHTINHFYLSLSFLFEKPRATGGAPFAKDFPGLSHFHPHVPTPFSVRVLTSRPFQKYFDVRAHVHPCT